MLNRRFVNLASHRSEILIPREGPEGAALIPAIRGTAAVFYRAADPDGTQCQLLPNAYERIERSAFDHIAGDNVKCLRNHNPDNLLGGTDNGTLKLQVDDNGLHYEVDTAPTTVGKDTVIYLERRDMRGSSFAFVPDKEAWTEGDEHNGSPVYVRSILTAKTHDVGPVTYEAYTATSTGLRSERSSMRCLEYRDATLEMRAVQESLKGYLHEAYHATERRQRMLRIVEMTAGQK